MAEMFNPVHAALCAAAEAMDEELKAMVRESDLASRLMTVPGIGPIVALSSITKTQICPTSADVIHLVMAVIGRLVDYVGLFERDLQFVTLAILHDLGKRPDEVFRSGAFPKFEDGRVLDAISDLRGKTEEEKATKTEVYRRIKFYFTDVYSGTNEVRQFRNHMAHLDMFAPGADLDLTHLVNKTRDMMAYDRKLKNAVSQSIRELLQREGYDLTWKMNAGVSPHRLEEASVQVGTATHLGGMKLPEYKTGNGRGRPRMHEIKEALHSAALTGAVAAAFGGKCDGVKDISTLDLAKIDFAAIDRNNERRNKGGKNTSPHRPAKGQKRTRRDGAFRKQKSETG